jgi:hypothetical protein
VNGELGLREADLSEISRRARYVVDSFPAGEVGLVIGPRETGKTWLLLDAAVRCAFGIGGCKPRPVVYVATEGMHGIRDRLAHMLVKHELLPAIFTSAQLGDMLRGRFMLAARPIRLDHPQLAERLIGTIRPRQAGMLFIDTVNKSLGGEQSENSNDDIGHIMAELEEVAAETDACVVLAHHYGHADKTRARGASAFEDGAGFVFAVTGTPEEFRLGRPVVLRCTKMKNAASPPATAYKLVRDSTVTLDGELLPGAVIEPVDLDALREFQEALSLQARLFIHVREKGGRDGLTARQIREVEGASADKDDARNALLEAGALHMKGTRWAATDGWEVVDGDVVQDDGFPGAGDPGLTDDVDDEEVDL